MNSADLATGLEAAAVALATQVEARAIERVAAGAAAAMAGSGDIVIEADGAEVLLKGRGLRARAFGSRRRAADPRFAGLLATLARGDG